MFELPESLARSLEAICEDIDPDRLSRSEAIALDAHLQRIGELAADAKRRLERAQQ
jgi:hypothetical protein